MITNKDVYISFRRAQGNSSGRGFRIPKDWDQFLEKMNPNNLKWLNYATMYFNTTYSNIDLDVYMSCGFELWKGFTYKHLLNEKVINLYIHKDKVCKRKIEVTHQEIKDSFDNIFDYMLDKPIRPGYSELQNFCKFRDGEIRVCVNMYVQGNIDSITLAYCVNKGYINLTDDERALSPYLVKRYREILAQLEDIKPFIIQKENELNEKVRGQTLSRETS